MQIPPSKFARRRLSPLTRRDSRRFFVGDDETEMILSEISVKRSVFATVISVLLTAVGLIAATLLSIQQYPNIASPTVSVSIRNRGASADVVETKNMRLVENELAAWKWGLSPRFRRGFEVSST